MDLLHIKRAIMLAGKGYGKTSPNPMVGAVIVRKNKIVGEGYHMLAGGKHAERIALERAGTKAAGATMYLNLEPCVHYGRTPPCADLIIESGISRVVACMKDPNPLVSGRGFKKLSGAGVAVEHGLLETEAGKLNESYIKYITTGRPFVTVKAGMTLDGKIATRTGQSRWITSEKSRKVVHKLRSGVDAILVGVETIIKDNPELTVRGIKHARQPYKIIVDSKGRTPPGAKALGTNPQKVIIAAGKELEGFRKKGINVIAAGGKNGKVNLGSLMDELAKREISTVLIEGGGKIIWSAFTEKIADKIFFFYAPKIFGGDSAPTAVEGEGFGAPDEAIRITGLKIKRVDEDILVEGYVKYPGENKCSRG